MTELRIYKYNVENNMLVARRCYTISVKKSECFDIINYWKMILGDDYACSFMKTPIS